MKRLLPLLISAGLVFSADLAIAQSATSNVNVIIDTSEGPITVELNREHVPATTDNFLSYVKQGFYTNTIFHRVIDGFMIQGGGFTPDMQEKSTAAPIHHEGSKCDKNTRGAIAMARTSDPHSATSQFFINVADNAFLDFKAETFEGWGYCAFGHVTKGMDVVDKIKSVSTTSRNGYQDVPVKDIVILKVEILPSKQ